MREHFIELFAVPLAAMTGTGIRALDSWSKALLAAVGFVVLGISIGVWGNDLITGPDRLRVLEARADSALVERGAIVTKIDGLICGLIAGDGEPRPPECPASGLRGLLGP